MGYKLECPCGTVIARRDDQFLPSVHEHLASEHPGREYPDDAILFLAMPVPDESLPAQG